jgi:serine/threonine protein phosphatase PrpC
LLVSRAIGDVETKGELKNEFWEDRAFSDDIVSCEPEVLLFARSVHDEFIVLACDG